MFETETVGPFLARKIEIEWRKGGGREYPPDLYTAKIRSSEFGCLRDKMVKNFFIFTNLRWKKNVCSFTLAVLCFTCLHIILPAQLCFTTD